MARPDSLAIVTGTTSGIGQATATVLLDRGWRVMGLARRDAVMTHPGYQHVVVDLAEPDRARRTLESPLTSEVIGRAWHRVGLVNNAASAGLLGPTAQIPPSDFVRLLALNVVAPVWLMGLVASRAPQAAALRIVNVSTGAAVHGFPGLSAYGSSKAALRMAGMVLAAEAEAGDRAGAPSRDLAILSYEPGTVDTPMQEATRAVPKTTFPWVDLFHRFKTDGLLVPPAGPAAEIADFLEGSGHGRFTERRYGRRD
jgi:benzil reductase ((S)-benzoin forming)